MSIEQTLRAALTNPQVLAGWAGLVALSLAVLVYDLRTNNSGIAPLMQFVWGLTVLYSGPLGLAVYAYSGRAAIERDSLWRRGFRSVAHCYAGCGAGEVVGVTLAAGLLSLTGLWVIAITFSCAYVLGYALTVGPLVQAGESVATAMRDALYSETPSITVMEISAIGTDVWLAGEATIIDPLFWSGLVVSLTVGLLVAYPVNVLLVHQGVKEGMQDPRQTAAGS